MDFRTDITVETLREIVHYDPDTGIFRWLPRMETDQYVATWNTRYAGQEAGNINYAGYVVITIHYQHMMAHRLAYLYMTGEHPPTPLDHIDRNKANNAWANLRLASHSSNGFNVTKRANNTSGAKGVYWHEGAQKWMVSVTHNKTTYYGGLFEDKTDAIDAANVAIERLHGDFAKLNDVSPDELFPPRVRTKPTRFNRQKQSNNTSGHKGVCKDKRSGRWIAQIGYQKKHYFLGYFDDIEDAIQAHKLKYEELHSPDI